MKHGHPRSIVLLFGMLFCLSTGVDVQAGDSVESAGDVLRCILPAAAEEHIFIWRFLGQRNESHKMQLRYLPIAIILLLFLLFSSSYSGEKQVSTGPADPVIREFVRLVNDERLGAGCPKLEWDDRIAAVAQEHSRDMVSRDFFSHTNPDGKDPFERLKESNLLFSAAAENIALGPRTGKEVYDTWLRSPGHRGNMLACRFTRHGVGRTGDRWTHVLFKP